MSRYCEAFYGSGLRLDGKEFQAFVDRYLEANKTSKEEIVEKMYALWNIERVGNNTDSEFDAMAKADEIEFVRSSDLSLPDGEKGTFRVTCVLRSDGCDGMKFQPYRMQDGEANLYRLARGRRNPGYIGFLELWYEDSYVFYSDRDMDAAEAFQRKPYRSYAEFEQEFKDKLGAYLPEDFDWNAHLGCFSYTVAV